MGKPGRILVFELNWMGDILFSFPFIRALRKAFPEARIACAIVPQYKNLLMNNPWINDVYTLSDDCNLLSIPEKLAFIMKIKKQGFDTCFFLKPSRTKAVMAAVSGISSRIGFEGKKTLLTKKVKIPAGHPHRAHQILALAAAAGAAETDSTYEYFVRKEDEDRAAVLLSEAGGGARRIVAINPGGNWDAKRWPPGNFAELARRLIDRFNDVELMITGAGKDIELARDIVSGAGNDRCYTVSGKTGVNELAALFKRCVLVISADSGPLHLASAVGATTIGLFGPTSRRITGPCGKGKNIVISKDIDCRIPCYIRECKKDYLCMKSITAGEVFEAAERVLS
ncbi:MAG: lipopolysaccharide heptosyltransferase II [Candidatus Makaraimicrobium thalassicum]|nr:MAG: lipopolysaccharide heptosyltransferase II [Candidatus Omnitrophota bacterium]